MKYIIKKIFISVCIVVAGSLTAAEGYLVFSACVPVVHRSFDGDGGDAECDFSGVGVGLEVAYYDINEDNGFTMLLRQGIAFGGSTLTADYGSRDAELNDISTFMAYARFGIGKAFFLDSPVRLIPTVGIGGSFNGGNGTIDSVTLGGQDITLDSFFCLTALTKSRTYYDKYMPNFKFEWGLSFSFEASVNILGAGGFDELGGYGINFGPVSFIPTIGIYFK